MRKSSKVNRKIFIIIILLIITFSLTLFWWLYTPTIGELKGLKGKEITTAYFTVRIKDDTEVFTETAEDRSNASSYSDYSMSTNDKELSSLSKMLNQIHLRFSPLGTLKNIINSSSKYNNYPEYSISGTLILNDSSVFDFYSNGDIFLFSNWVDSKNSEKSHKSVKKLEYKLLNKEIMDEIVEYIKTNSNITAAD